jgi:DNA invertase Pin-like site-specific DNA recombinase
VNELAVAICRVSTPEQRLNNSLPRQEESALKAASELGVEIIKWWSGDASSKVGKNVKRKDLNEAYTYCKGNRRIKYLIVDEVDRFMRSTAEMFYWIIKFQEIGVKVHFACNPELNAGDAKARLLLSLDGFKAEGSNEERQHKSISGHEKALREGRHTFPTKPGYAKGDIPGVKLPHPITFKPFQAAMKEVLSGLHTPTDALKRLNKSEFAKVHAPWSMDKFRQFATDPYYAGILVMEKQVKERNECGQHEAMISLEDHEELVRIFTGKFKPRGTKKQYNPEFPMNKVLVCEDCGCEAKFTGSPKNNGYNRKTTTTYWKYECRGCHKSYHRQEVHDNITKRLSEIQYTGKQRQELIEALATVWGQKKKDKLQQIKALEQRSVALQQTKSKLVVEMAQADTEYKQDIKDEIDKIKAQIADNEALLNKSDELNEDLLGFVKFGLEYTNNLMDDWWTLDHEERVRCQQLILPGGISFNHAKKVGTPEISSIYSIQPNKKDLRFDRKSLMVEHLEKSSPLVIAEIERWNDIIGDDYLHYKFWLEREQSDDYRLRVTPTTTSELERRH